VGENKGEVGRGVREHKRGKERTQEREGENRREGGRKHGRRWERTLKKKGKNTGEVGRKHGSGREITQERVREKKIGLEKKERVGENTGEGGR
jgi:hypothetical protein